jgi:hypothetical protein
MSAEQRVHAAFITEGKAGGWRCLKMELASDGENIGDLCRYAAPRKRDVRDARDAKRPLRQRVERAFAVEPD